MLTSMEATVKATELVQLLVKADLFDNETSTEEPLQVNGEDWVEYYGWKQIEGDWAGWKIEFANTVVEVEKATYWEPGWAYGRTWFEITTPDGKVVDGEYDDEYGLTVSR
jgi:hypothetical protein